MRRAAVGALILAGLSLLPPRAEATLAEALSLSQLVERSTMAAEVVVRQQHARWDDRRRIVTDVELEVIETLKGEPVTDFVLTVLGGSIGDLGMRIEGEPSFVDSERYVVFVRPWNGGWRPVGMSQGVFRVQQDSGREIVVPGGGGLSLVRQREGELRPATGALVFRRPLSALKDQVRDLAHAQ